MTYATNAPVPRAPGSYRSPFSDQHVDQATIQAIPHLSGSFAATSAIEQLTETPWERSLRRARVRDGDGLGKGEFRGDSLLSLDTGGVTMYGGGNPILIDASPVLENAPAALVAGGMSDARRDELLSQYKADQDQLIEDAIDFMLAYANGARHQFWYAQTGRQEAPPDWWRPSGFYDDDPSNPSGVAFYALAHGFTDYDSIAGSGSGAVNDIVRAGADRGNILPYMTAEEYAAYYNNNPQRPPQPPRFVVDQNSEWVTMQIPGTFPPGPGTSLERPASGSYAGFNPGGTEDDTGDPTYTPTHTSTPNPDDPNGPPIIVPIPTLHPDAPPGYDPLDHPGLEPVDVPNPQLYPAPTDGGGSLPPGTTTTPTGGTPPTGGGGLPPSTIPPVGQAGFSGGMGLLLGGGLLLAIVAGGKKKKRGRR